MLPEDDKRQKQEVFVDDLEEQVRLVADDIIAEYPGASLDYLSDGLERQPDSYEDGPGMARLVAAELRRRAAEEALPNVP